MKLGIVVGNPNPKSRTLTLAEAVGDEVGTIVGETSRFVVDLVDLAAGLFEAAQEAWTEHVRAAAEGTMYTAASCDSWYNGQNIEGKPRVFPRT